MRDQSSRRYLKRSLSVLILFLLVSLLFGVSGCGNEESEVIVINLEFWGIDFYTPPQPQTGTFLYMVERALYTSVLRFEKLGPVYQMMGTIWPTYGETFSPYTVSLGTGASSDVMFVADITPGNPRLLAMNPVYSGDVGLGTVMYASTGGTGSDLFVDLGGVACLTLDNNTYRVFLADANRIWIIDYDVPSKHFSIQEKISKGCGHTLLAPYGLDVDPGEGMFDGPSLYAVDYDLETLFRFDGIDRRVLGPSCSGSLKSWDQGGDAFRDPRGVAVLPGQSSSDSPLVVVADAKNTAIGNNRVTAFTWNGRKFMPTGLPENFLFFPNAYPFGLAFDPNRDLFATYPEAGAVAGPAY